MERYPLIFDYLPKLDIDDIDKLSLSTRENQELQNIFDLLQRVESVTVTLQLENVILSEFRVFRHCY